MVRGIDILNVIANAPYVNREQQIAQAMAAFGPAADAQKAQKDEDLKKEQVQDSKQTEQEQSVVDPNRRETLLRRRQRRRRQSFASEQPGEGTERPGRKPESPDGRGHLIDVEA